MTTAKSRERKVGAKRFGQSCRIDSDLRHITVRHRAGEEFAIAFIDENVKDGLIEGGVHGMAVRFPIPIYEIDFNAAALGRSAVQANGSVFEIGACFPIPGAELNHFNLVAARAAELSAELTGKPSSLKFQLIRNPQRKEKSGLAHASCVAQFRIAQNVLGGGHRSRETSVVKQARRLPMRKFSAPNRGDGGNQEVAVFCSSRRDSTPSGPRRPARSRKSSTIC